MYALPTITTVEHKHLKMTRRDGGHGRLTDGQQVSSRHLHDV